MAVVEKDVWEHQVGGGRSQDRLGPREAWRWRQWGRREHPREAARHRALLPQTPLLRPSLLPCRPSSIMYGIAIASTSKARKGGRLLAASVPTAISPSVASGRDDVPWTYRHCSSRLDMPFAAARDS